MPMNETALIAKTGAAPSHATRKPANAGPMARAAFTVMLPSAAAFGIWARGTRSGWIACHAGLLNAEPQPMRNVMLSKRPVRWRRRRHSRQGRQQGRP